MIFMIERLERCVTLGSPDDSMGALVAQPVGDIAFIKAVHAHTLW